MVNFRLKRAATWAEAQNIIRRGNAEDRFMIGGKIAGDAGTEGDRHQQPAGACFGADPISKGLVMQVVWLALGPEGVGRDRQPRYWLVCRRLDLTDLFHV